MSKLAPNSTTMYVANPTDSHGVGGFYIQGNLPISNDQGVHSLTDVPVYAWGAGKLFFRLAYLIEAETNISSYFHQDTNLSEEL